MSSDAANENSDSAPSSASPFVPTLKIRTHTTFSTANLGGAKGDSKGARYTDAEACLDAYIQNHKNKPPLSLKSRIMQVIVRRKIDAAACKNYAEASKLSKIEDKLKIYFEEAKESDRIRKRSYYGISSSDQLRTRLSKINNEYDRKIEIYKRSREQFMDQLYNDQQRELAEFGKKWNNPNSFLDLAKPSSHLLQLREIERKKALLMDYEGANQTKAIADKLEKQETAQSQQKAVQAMKTQLKQLEAKHQQEIEGAEQLTKRGLDHLLKERASIVEPLEKALRKSQNMEKRQPEKRRPNSRMNSTIIDDSVSFAPTTQTKSARAPSPVAYVDDEVEDVDLATPRTFRKIYDMRATSGVKRLDLDGIDITKYLKPDKSNSRGRSRTALSNAPPNNSNLNASNVKTTSNSRSIMNSSSSFRRSKSTQRSPRK